MPNQPNYNELQQALLKIFKVLSTQSAKILMFGSGLLAIATLGGAALPASLVPLAAGVGINVISSMLERVARGEIVSDDEILQTIKNSILSSDIENKTIFHDIQREIAHLFRRFDLIEFAVQKGEIAVLNLIQEKFLEIGITLQKIEEDVKSILETTKQIQEYQSITSRNYPIELINKKIEEELDRLQKSRFFVEFDRVSITINLANKLIEREYSGGTDSLRSLSLAWCARILSTSGELQKAEELLQLSKNLGNNPDIELAQAFIYSNKNEKSTALDILAKIDLPSSRSAALMIVADHDGCQGAIDWLSNAGLSMLDLDSDGKSSLISYHHQLSNWEETKECLDKVTDEDLLRTPILFHLVALSHLLVTIPNEFRYVILNQLPFQLIDFPLASNLEAIESRRLAHHYFNKASKIAEALNLPHTATVEEDYSIWLELMDPKESDKGKQRLKNKLNDPKSSIRYVNFGIQFGLPINLELVEKEIEREIAIHGGITENAAVARLSLSYTKKTPEEAANYLAQHKNELKKFINENFINFLEIGMLSQAGLLQRANDNLNSLIEKGISKLDESRLRRIIDKAEGINHIESLKEQYRTTDSLSDLIVLVDELESKGKWNDLCEFSRILFEDTQSLLDAERFAISLNNSNQFERCLNFLKENRDLISQSKKLRYLFCWSLFYEGDLLEAKSELERISIYSSEQNYRTLEINIALTIGDVNTLLKIISNDYDEKENRSAQELINAAQLALNLGSPLSKDLIFAAAKKGGEDANILSASFFLATNAGLDDDEIYQWFHKATLLSGTDGPIKKMNLKEILDLNPDWNRREQEIWQQLIIGDLPMFLAAQSLNKSLINLMLFQSIFNLKENDPRRRGAIPAYSGRHQATAIPINGKIGIDATALYTLGFLDLIDKVFQTLETIYLPHTTLQWLFDEKQFSAFHQPNQIKKAHNVINLLANHSLEMLKPSTAVDSDLAVQIGKELAQLIAEAEKARDSDIHCVVVRSSPVHRLSSLLEEEADLTRHSALLSSCVAIVEKLKQKRQITERDEIKIRAFLQLHEKPWSQQPEIADDSILFLDSLSITYFQQLGLIEKLKAAGFKPIISPEAIERYNQLISYESISGDVTKILERIHSAIISRIDSGKIKFGGKRIIDEQDKKAVFAHPSVDVFLLAKECDSIIIDDRSINQHGYINEGGKQATISTTLDLIAGLEFRGLITTEEQIDYLTKLRLSGYFLIPINEKVLATHLFKSLKNGKIIETAELNSIRENFLQVRMSNWLKMPEEVFWLNTSLNSLIHVLKGLWVASNNISEVRVLSNWILHLLDFRGWAHFLGNEISAGFVKFGSGINILQLLLPPLDEPQEIIDEYLIWVEENILIPIKDQNPDLFNYIVDWYTNLISEYTNKYLIKLEENL